MATATIKLSSITYNVSRIKSYLAPNVKLLAAVKANAYGHGAVPYAKHLANLGVNWLGVATAKEALELCRAGLNSKILILNPIYHNLEELIENNIYLSIVDKNSLAKIELAARALNKKAIVHLKVDTGMGRLGINYQEALAVAKKADAAKFIIFEGIWTHFACADEQNPEYTHKQLANFQDLLDVLQKHQVNIPLKHTANSAGIIAFPDSHFDIVRAGIALYGYHASSYIQSLEPNLRPVMTVTAPITFVKHLKAGQSVSYGATWTARKDTTIATIRYGYADGYPRILSNRASVFCKGKLRPIRGRVCMDQFMIDMDNNSVEVGELVTIFGETSPSAEDIAKFCNTIAYEILTSVGNRVQRIYT